MQDSQHFNAGIDGAEVEAVVAKGIAATAFREFRTWTSDGLPLAEIFQLVAHALPEPVGLENTVLGNVVPNLVQVAVSQL